jgi:hypothetical protein
LQDSLTFVTTRNLCFTSEYSVLNIVNVHPPLNIKYKIFAVFCVCTGGETIKQINQQTGAHCELDRRPPPNPAEKVFVIRGSPDQIEQAKRIISEKIGMVCSNFCSLHNVKILSHCE